MRAPSASAVEWATEQFGEADLGDARRTERLIHSAACILEHPAGSLPAKFQDPADLDSFYRLVNRPEVSHRVLIHTAAQRTWQRMRDHPVVLLLHDTTVLDYSGLHSITDLGQVGDGHGKGLYCHNSLAVTPQRRVLGLAWQILHRRRKVKKGETKTQRQKAPDRESRLWKKACENIPNAPQGQLWVDVADRGADITEFLAHEHKTNRKYVVRSQHNRKVLVEQADGSILSTKLHDHVRSLTQMSSQVRVRDIPATDKRPARQAQLVLAWVKLKIVPPRQARGEHDNTPLEVWAVRVWEKDPPEGETGIEWILLSNVEVSNEEDAWERVDWYTARWTVEEYHKGQKTGCEIENLQFTTRSSLDAAIAVLSVVTVWLLQMRDASRDEELRSQPAVDLVPLLWVIVLSVWRHKRACPDWTYGEFVLALARLGGHQNRKSDHPPGWIVLWRGWAQLQAMIAGALAVSSG